MSAAMSFQGDVGGIGLADLLQSLARGRDGILTLSAKGGMRATIGFGGGQMHLLPDPEEDPEIWRARVRRAWVEDPDFRVDGLRMADIAHSARLELLYTMLDTDQVHFRFLPGPLPMPSTEGVPTVSTSEPGTDRSGTRRDAVFCAPMSVEGALLEYARLKDELIGSNVQFRLPDHAILVPESPNPQGSDAKRMFEELDGRTTLIEAADRLSWPLRQLRSLASVALVQGSFRPPELSELFEFALREMIDGHFGRASSRLRGWVELSPPGPLDEATFDNLRTEWQASRLQPVLRELPKDITRTLFQRMEASKKDAVAAVETWSEFLRLYEGDRLASFALLVAQIRSSRDQRTPALKDLVAVARLFQSKGAPRRAAPLWRIAAARKPEHHEQRLEVGLGLLAANLIEEATPWILDASKWAIEKGKPETATEPLRRLVEADPGNRDARKLLYRARTQVVQRTFTKKNTLVTASVVLALSVGAVVTFQTKRETSKKLAEISANLSQPHVALKMLDAAFPGEDQSARVRDLRATLIGRCKAEDNASRTAWTDIYREAQVECTIGEARLGLARALELPPPPKLAASEEPLPLVSDLFNGLSARIDKELTGLGDEVRDDTAEIAIEAGVLTRAAELRAVLEARNAATPEAKDFGARLVGIEKRVRERELARTAARKVREHKENLQKQDRLLAAARSQSQVGDYEKALESYQKLLAIDLDGKLTPLLAREIQSIQGRVGARVNARALALAGKHEEALRVIAESKDVNESLALPWKLEVRPLGATARFRDGSTQPTPLVLESARNDRYEVVLEHTGFVSSTLRVDGPRDHFVWLSRQPVFEWKAEGRVEALPVIAGDGRLLCDRAGTLAFLGADGALRWSRKLESLGGIARTPVELPGKPGSWLLITEDGEWYVLDAASGELSPPRALPNPPREGPIVLGSRVSARLRDGSIATWNDSVEPLISSARDLGPDYSDVERALAAAGSFGARGPSVLRRRTDAGARLITPDGKLSVRFDDENYYVERDGVSEPLFAVRRKGEWSYFAWETDANGAGERLWIADELGVRCVAP